MTIDEALEELCAIDPRLFLDRQIELLELLCSAGDSDIFFRLEERFWGQLDSFARARDFTRQIYAIVESYGQLGKMNTVRDPMRAMQAGDSAFVYPLLVGICLGSPELRDSFVAHMTKAFAAAADWARPGWRITPDCPKAPDIAKLAASALQDVTLRLASLESRYINFLTWTDPRSKRSWNQGTQTRFTNLTEWTAEMDQPTRQRLVSFAKDLCVLRETELLEKYPTLLERRDCELLLSQPAPWVWKALGVMSIASFNDWPFVIRYLGTIPYAERKAHERDFWQEYDLIPYSVAPPHAARDIVAAFRPGV